MVLDLTDSRTINIALVGAGAMGSLHARVVSQTPGVELACIVDPCPEVGRRLAAQFESRWLPDLDGTGLIDAVIVASPTDTHASWVERALDAGKPVLVEKPLSTDLAEVEAMVKRSGDVGVPIMGGFVERFNPAILLVMDILKDPLYLQAVRHSPYVNRIRTGVAHDLLIHDVDLALRVFGGVPEEVRGQLGHFHRESEPGAEDVADFHLTFERGRLASLSSSRITQRKIRSVTITELDRLIEIDMIRQDVTIYRHVGHEIIEDNWGYRSQTIIDVPVIPSRREPLATQLDHFVALIRGTVDPEVERLSLVPPHEVVANALASVAT
ncbi:MAG: Gfo/Idh/MocA family oxidoreductase [Actinomycetota bacterium]